MNSEASVIALGAKSLSRSKPLCCALEPYPCGSLRTAVGDLWHNKGPLWVAGLGTQLTAVLVA
jgi:hypothetical protein